MPLTKEKAVEPKRGRKSSQEVRRQVILALKNLQELGLLEESPLVRLPGVRRLAEREYHSAIFPSAFALRSLLMDTANAVTGDLAKIPNYHREVTFIQAFVQGDSVADISRRLSLSREHVARTVQPRALNLVARVFLEKAASNDGAR